jgi:DNA repair protein RecN (Recombination protein N)
MLRELSVQNLAVIEDVRVELQDGFCAWTGETGAGKSLLLGALGLMIGERGSTELIRSGADELRVTGQFELNRPDLRLAVEAILEHELEDAHVIVARRLPRAGHHTAANR